jgi:hypothetical protein
MFRKSLFLAMGLAAALTVSQARAGSVDISTGVLTYSVTGAGVTAGYNKSAVFTPPDIHWATPPAGSSWIAPIESGGPDTNPKASKPNGVYDYTTTFTLSSANAYLSGVATSDDTITGIVLNGHAIAFTTPEGTGSYATAGYKSLWPLTIPTGDFVAGVNTITFDTANVFGSVTGLLVSATVTTIPEPASMALLGIGLSGLLTLRRFFKRTSVA